MHEKTIILRKKGHWYIFTSRGEDEREILLTLLQCTEHQHYLISREEVLELAHRLGWRVEIYPTLRAVA